MKKKPLIIGVAVLVVLAVGAAAAMRGRGHKPLEVQTARADLQRIVLSAGLCALLIPARY